MAKKKKPEEPQVRPKDETWCVWIGPGFRGIIQHGQIFPVPRERVREVIPPKLAALWDDGAGALFVGPDQLPEARIAVKREGSALSKLAKAVSRKLSGK